MKNRITPRAERRNAARKAGILSRWREGSPQARYVGRKPKNPGAGYATKGLTKRA